MNKLDTITNYLKSINFNNGYYTVGQLWTLGRNGVPDVYFLRISKQYTSDDNPDVVIYTGHTIYVTTNPKKTKYKGSKVIYYKNIK